ncbi:MAG: SDR family oxidoreductase [Bacteroidales bacterium]|nr:SDR family oxidoreductase [Bacteroidales bacterium]
MNLRDKVIWITGASSGIGEATAYLAIKKGAKVILSSNQEKELKDVTNNCLELGGEAKSVYVDLNNSESLPKVAEKAIACFGRIDILFNNGGISQRATTMETSMEVQRRVMQINFFSAVELTKCILPHMIEQGGGLLAATTSIAGKFGFPLRSAYCSSKHALYGFFETVRAEYVKDNIRVTFLCPGRVRTNISMHALDKNGKPTGKMDAGLAGGIPVEKAAAKIIRSFEKEKKDVLIGGKELLMVYIKKYLPRLFYKIVPNIKPT